MEPGNNFDISILPLETGPNHPNPGKPSVFLSTPFAELHPAFSPDGKWLAYNSDDTGTFEVYVRSFPDSGGRWQISSGGGVMPVWSPKGGDLYYRTLDNRIMVAAYRTAGGSFGADKPRLWSDKQFDSTASFSNFDIAPDGKRFVVVTAVEQAGGPEAVAQVTFLFNFFDELRRKVPPGGGK